MHPTCHFSKTLAPHSNNAASLFNEECFYCYILFSIPQTVNRSSSFQNLTSTHPVFCPWSWKYGPQMSHHSLYIYILSISIRNQSLFFQEVNFYIFTHFITLRVGQPRNRSLILHLMLWLKVSGAVLLHSNMSLRRVHGPVYFYLTFYYYINYYN
jgi:hypothetical protein